jgi:chromosome partitioning protein
MIGVLANQKGGVAKTTNTVHLGASLAAKGYNVLLIDFDSQCDLSHNVGVDPGEDHFNVIDLLEQKKDFTPAERAPNLFVVVGSVDFVSNKYHLNDLKKMLSKDRGGFVIKDYFDFILIDCPPSKIVVDSDKKYNHSEIELALFASDFFLVPLKADDFSVKNANTFLGKASAFIQQNDIHIEFLGFFFSCILLTENSLEYYTQMFKDNSGDLLLNSYIRQDAEVKKAVQVGKTIFQHKPTCRAAEDYIKLTDEFLTIIQK